MPLVVRDDFPSLESLAGFLILDFGVEIFHHISQLPGELTDGQPLFAGESEVRALHGPKGPQRSALV